MSYPRNAASPPVIAVGAIYLLADGTIQTTGASARVKTGSGAWGAAAGTLACDSTSGVWTYTPAQTETDAESFLVAVYKSASTTAQVTVATSASATAGYSGVDWGKVTAATSTVNLSGTTISTTQQVASVSGAVGSVTGAVGSVTGSVGSVTGNVGGNVVGSVGGISGVTFPTNFNTLGINSSGHLLRVTLCDTTTTNTDMRGTNNAALASAWTAARAGYLDSVVLAANSNQRTVQITGSNHVAADIHEFQPDVLTSEATDATFVAEMQFGLATDSKLSSTYDLAAWLLTAAVGNISNAQTAAESFELILQGVTYTVTGSGMTESGNRGTTTLSKV
jgi:hypothetical protein